jgi:hypothetical protein
MLIAHPIALLVPSGHDIRVNLLNINMRNLRVRAIEDLGDRFECRTAGFDIEEAGEEEFQEEPDLSDYVKWSTLNKMDGGTYCINGIELPIRLQVVKSKRVDALVNYQRNLDEKFINMRPLARILKGRIWTV